MVSSTLDEFCGSVFWEPQKIWNNTQPDLTPCFQATVLTWVPCSTLWLLAPLECYFMKKSRYRILPWTGAIITRMVVAFILAILCATNMLDILINHKPEIMYAASLTSSSLKALTFLFIVILMLFNKKRGRHTSGVLFVFWVVLAICEGVQYRSAFIQIQTEVKQPDDISFVTHMIYFPLVIAELILSCIADVRYRHKPSSPKDTREESPETLASFLSNLTFWWFNGMSYLGFKKPLILDDLWDLNPCDKTAYIAKKFEPHCKTSSWAHIARKVSIRDGSPFMHSDEKSAEETEVIVNGIQETRREKINIVKSLVKTFWAPFLVASIWKFFFDILQFVNPILLKYLIAFVGSKDDPIWIGVFYACCMFVNGTIQSVLLGSYFQRMFVLGMRVRTALVTAIYKKSLLLSSTARKESTVGEIVNLMSVDSQRFMDLMAYLNMIWSAPLQIALSLILLYQQLKASVFAGLAVMIMIIPFNLLLTSKIKKMQTIQMKRKDERVKLINEVLSGIKVLKLYAWEVAFKKKIDDIRNKEVKDLKKIAYLNACAILLWSCSPFFVALASFACYVLVDENNVLDASTAFVSLSLFNVLRFPLIMLPNLITFLIMTRVSVKRINKYMNGEELEKYVKVDSSQEHPLCIRNGTFSWSKPEDSEEKEFKPTLRSVNLNVAKGSLVAIVGQVGSGKSSLLSAILGDMVKLSGTVTINGSTALVSQQPWIQNSTLQNNILFSNRMNRKFYKEVIEVSGLEPDLKILPGGDQTEIGEKGINLSGGQKQRVSLARAVYSDADIYLLDDPLSAVDSHVGKHIFEKVIGPNGLLKNKTRILVTHGLTYLPQADVVYVMKDGVIAEKGSFQELIDSKGPFAEFLSQYLQQVQDIEEDLEVLEELSEKNPELLRSLSSKSNTEEESYPQSDTERKMSILSINRPPLEHSISKSSERSVNIEKSIQNADGKLTNIETAETGKVKWTIYLQYMKAISIIPLVIILVAYISWQGFSVGANVWLSEWGNDKHLNGSEGIEQRNFRLGVYGVLGLGDGLCVFIGTFAIAHGTLLAANVLHDSLLLNVLKSPMSFFDTTPIGRIVNRFAKDIDTVDVTIPMTIRSWLSCLLQVISVIIVICFQTPIFICVVLPVSILYYFIQRFYVATSRQLKRLESITRSPVYSHFSETLAGASTIRAYGAEERFCSRSNSLIDDNQICYYPSILANRWLAIRLDFCGNVIIFFAALLAVLQRDNLDAGKIGLSITYALMITQTMNWLVRMTSELETNIVAVERILEYSVTPTEAEWVLEGNRPSKEWPQDGQVVFDNYSTQYRKGLDLVLREICCNVNPGEKIGIVGRTGAGKSSLTLSLFRIIEAVKGSIEIDKQNISKIGLHDLRSKITIIPQDPVLFSGTLRMNLDPFEWYSDSKLWEALDHAHLKSFVSSLDAGLDYDVVEGGENLSVGQRQLVCLARALLRKTKILVLDEATAAVDLETDSLIQTTIRKEFANSSVLTIAHRLNTVMDYDRIMVLDKGEVAEFDAPTVLLKNKKSIFYGMAKDAGLV